MVNHAYVRHAADGSLLDSLIQGVYHFAPGTGPAVMAKVHKALADGCGSQSTARLIPGFTTTGDDVVVYTGDNGTSVDILVRVGDDISSGALVWDPSGGGLAHWVDTSIRTMTARLKTSP